jgi:phage gp16-like protein
VRVVLAQEIALIATARGKLTGAIFAIIATVLECVFRAPEPAMLRDGLMTTMNKNEKASALRQRLYTLLQVGKNELGWDDEFYRGIWLPMQGATKDKEGRYSASTLDIGQLYKAIEEMKRLGFKVKAKADTSNRALADDAQSKKIRALWLELHDLGAVRNPSEASLAAYVKRQTGVEALQWLSNRQATQVIEALKQWRTRIAPQPEPPEAA